MDLAVKVQICRMPGANIGVGAAIVALPPDARVLGRSSAIAIGVQSRCGIRVVVGSLVEIDTGRAEAVVTNPATTEIVGVSVVAPTVAAFAEMGIVITPATLESSIITGTVGEGVGNVDEFNWGFGAADCEFDVGGRCWGFFVSLIVAQAILRERMGVDCV